MGVSALVDAESHSKNANTSTNQLQGSDGQLTKTSSQRISMKDRIAGGAHKVAPSPGDPGGSV